MEKADWKTRIAAAAKKKWPSVNFGSTNGENLEIHTDSGKYTRLTKQDLAELVEIFTEERW